MTNAQKLARDCALDILKAYNAKIFQSVATPEQRERAQAAAYIAAELHIRKSVLICNGTPWTPTEYLERKALDES